MINHIIFFLLFSIILLLILNYILKKKNILIDNHKSGSHKISKHPNVIVSGGIFFSLCFASIILYFDISYSYFYLIIIFFVGILSDLEILNSPKIRLLIQTIYILSLVYLFKITIEETRIDIVDVLLNNSLFGIIFTASCLLVLINGANFIDGLNGLSSGYFFLVLIFLLILFNTEKIFLEKELANFFYILIPLFIFFSFNLKSINFSGDAGAYFIATIVGFLSIEISSTNVKNLSPIFIVILFWYPVFENLFSFIRRTVAKNSQIKADKVHLHHLIYFYFLRNFKLKNRILCNSISSLSILLYNLIVFIISINFVNNSIVLSSMVILNIFIYVIIYFKLYLDLKLPVKEF